MLRRVVLFFLLVLLLPCGCISTSKAKDQNLSSIQYIPLVDLCVQRQMSWDYDPLSKVVLLNKNLLRVKLLIGSRLILVNGVMKSLSLPVVLKNGVVYAPADLTTYIEKG